MDYENLHNEALTETLRLVTKGINQPLERIKSKYSSGKFSMTEEQWDFYYQNLPTYILENAENKETVKNFLSDYSILNNSILEIAVKDNNVQLEYISIVLEKQKEELLIAACNQESSDVLHYILEKYPSLANFRLFDGRFILHYAMQFGSEDIIRTLLYFGAIIDVEDNRGRNVMHYAGMNKSHIVWIHFSNDPLFVKFLKRADCFGKIPQERFI